MAIDGTKLSVSEFKIKDPKKVTDFPGCFLNPEDIEYGRIVYTIGTLEERAKNKGVLFYRGLPIVKTDVLTGQDIVVNPTGYFDNLFEKKEDVIKKVTRGFSLFDIIKETANKYVLDIACIKKDFSKCVKEAYKKNTKEEFSKIQKILEKGYEERRDKKSEALKTYKEELKLKLRDDNNYGPGIDFLIKNLEFFCDGLVIGSKPAADFSIKDGYISRVHGIISLKDDKLVYNDLGLNRTLVCTLRDEGKGLNEFEEENGSRVLMDIGSNKHKAAYIFLGKPIPLVSNEQKPTVESLGYDAVTASLKIDANKSLKADENWTKHYICIAKGGKLPSK